MNSTTPDHARRILIIDDTESIHDDFRKALIGTRDTDQLHDDEALLFGAPRPGIPQARFDIDSALQGREGYDAVARAVSAGQPYAVAFVDMRMPPGWDGVQTIAKLWEADPDLQVVICTAYSDYSWEAIVEKLGVSDRLLVLRKPFDAAEVCQLALALSEKRAMTQQARLKVDDLETLVRSRTDALAHAATHDRLTGLANRAKLVEHLQAAMHRHRAGEGTFAAFFLDFDRFKIINDSLGHTVGDQMLIAIARRITAALTELNIPHLAARFGGDEFVVLIESADHTLDAAHIADKLLAALRTAYHLESHEVFSTASLGLVLADRSYERPEDILRDADSAMYRAKTHGKDRLVIFDQSMRAQTVSRLELETDLRRAVERGELVLHHQPIVSLASGRIESFEALLRWEHPRRGLIHPDQFIPIAEETGLIVPIGNWLMRDAMMQLRRWQQAFPSDPPLRISINLSKRQLLEPRYSQQVRAIAADVDIDPASIILEVTETLIMDHPEVIVPALEELARMGFAISMDDFGTGHSSLHCLNKFPIDILKIDRAFIHQLENQRDYAAVIHAILALAQNMDVRVVAEGLETQCQLAQILALDCHSAQGYLFSPPVPAHIATGLLASGLESRFPGHQAQPLSA